MSLFQSYLITAPNQVQARQATKKLAKSLGIDIEKASPDVFFIRRKTPFITALKKQISIDQVRELKGHIFEKPFKEKYKFIVMENADSATAEAQNSLLKILEEPPAHAILVMEAKNKSQLLPTILSRIILVESKTSPTDEQTQNLLEKDLESALSEISTINDPQEFLDRQIIFLTDLLIKSARKKQASSTSELKIAQAIEKCKDAKEMIEANVNPTFTLANLVFSLNLASK